MDEFVGIHSWLIMIFWWIDDFSFSIDWLFLEDYQFDFCYSPFFNYPLVQKAFEHCPCIDKNHKKPVQIRDVQWVCWITRGYFNIFQPLEVSKKKRWIGRKTFTGSTLCISIDFYPLIHFRPRCKVRNEIYQQHVGELSQNSYSML